MKHIYHTIFSGSGKSIHLLHISPIDVKHLSLFMQIIIMSNDEQLSSKSVGSKKGKRKLSIADEGVRLNDDGYLLFADLIQCK
jgi:hypothetical protein